LVKTYSRKEAEALLPSVIRNAALSIIDSMICLDSNPVISREFESRILQTQGYIAYIMKLCHTIWKARGIERAEASLAVG